MKLLHFPLFALALASAWIGCSRTKEQNTPAPVASGSASARAPASAAPTPPGDDEVHPVYPVTNAPPEPIAQKLCEAIHTLPATRKAACCNQPPPTTVVSECTRMLSFALREKAVTIDAAAVDRCGETMARAYDGCGWVGPTPPAIPPECDGVIHGTLSQGASCRSSLECVDGLHCHGAGPTDRGVCSPPAGRGRVCGVAVDTLAVHTRQDSFETKHPECDGVCARRRCMDTVAAGGACKSHLECGIGRACIDHQCSQAPLPVAGNPCRGGLCAPGARCVNGQCIAPKAEGEPCEKDIECRGACERPDAGAAGHCGKRCGLF